MFYILIIILRVHTIPSCGVYLASYPGLLTPAFVTCSTIVGKSLVKLSHMQWRTWTCGGVAHSRKNSK